MSTKEVSKEQYSKILDGCQSSCKGKYCFYKKFLESQRPAIYVFLQIKMIEKAKWVWVERGELKSNDEKQLWDEASFKWIGDGLAKAYREAFDKIFESDNINYEVQEDIIADLLFNKTLEVHKEFIDKNKV